jgi:guanylate kinase
MELEERIRTYEPAETAVELIRQTKIVLLVGVSGAGKDTIKNQLLKRPDYHHIVSHTTRPPRANHGVMETDGVEYHFIDLPTAQSMLEKHGYIEAKFYSGNIYGTSIAEIQMAHDEGKVAITDMEIQGVDEYIDFDASTVKPIFILPPDYETWQQRLSRRYGDGIGEHSADLARRLETSKIELRHALESEYYYLVVNDDVDAAVATVDQIAHSTEPADHYRDEKLLNIVRGLLESLETR